MGRGWKYGFKPEEQVSTDQLVAVCERRIESGQAESP